MSWAKPQKMQFLESEANFKIFFFLYPLPLFAWMNAR